jgi:glucose-fructose oxidoreductase
VKDRRTLERVESTEEAETLFIEDFDTWDMMGYYLYSKLLRSGLSRHIGTGGSRDRRFREIEESVAATMRFRDERLASFNCSFGAADRATYTVTGSHGSVTLDSAYEYVDAISSRVRIGEREQTRQFGKRDQFAAELEYFSQCILDNRTPEPSGAEGLADVRIIEAMHRSIRSGRWVEVKMPVRKRRPTVKQNIRRPPVPSEPDLVDVKAASQ